MKPEFGKPERPAATEPPAIKPGEGRWVRVTGHVTVSIEVDEYFQIGSAQDEEDAIRIALDRIDTGGEIRYHTLDAEMDSDDEAFVVDVAGRERAMLEEWNAGRPIKAGVA